MYRNEDESYLQFAASSAFAGAQAVVGLNKVALKYDGCQGKLY